MLDASLGAVCWFLFGFGVAMGDSSGNRFIGRTMYALNTEDFFVDDQGRNYAFWLFQWSFAAATATIVSGAVAERCTFTAYLVYSIALTSFIYPVIACWGWNADGWASPWREDNLLFSCGLIDFAGSGIVHMTGELVNQSEQWPPAVQWNRTREQEWGRRREEGRWDAL